MGLMMVVVACRSKSRQKSKNLKGLKNLQRPVVRRNICRSTDPPSVHGYKELELFRFAGLKSSLNTTFGSIIDKAKLTKLLMLCHVFPQRSEEGLRAENIQILRRLQFSLTNASIFSTSLSLTPLHQVLTCGTHILPPLSVLGHVPELQEEDVQAQKIRAEMLGRIPRGSCIIQDTSASRRLENSLPGNTIVRHADATSVYPPKRSDTSLTVTTQSWPIPTHCWKDLSMDYVMGLPISTDWKGTNHDSDGIAYVYRLEGHQLRFDPCHRRPADSLKGLIDELCDWIAYIYGLEGHQLRFDPRHRRPADENGTLRVGADNDRCTRAGGGNFRRCSSTPRSLSLHLQVMIFLVLLLRHQAKSFHRLPPLNRPACKDGYTPFKLNCGHHPRVSYKNIDSRSRFKAVDELAYDFKNLMTACRKNLRHGLDIANPFPPDLWGYVHGFGYHDVQWRIR